MANKKFFTVTEANSLIPRLLIDIPKIQKLSERLETDFPDVAQARRNAHLNGGSMHGAEYLRVAKVFQSMIKDLEEKGCILKGIEHGLVDFLGLIEGREVYLCWKLPEQKIEFWHDINGGFAGRRKIQPGDIQEPEPE